MAQVLEDSSVNQINPDWLCVICQNISKDPVTLNNDHHIYCKICINNWFEKRAVQSKPLTHPMTNVDITCDYKLHPQKQLKKQIAKFREKYRGQKDEESKAFYAEHLSHFDTAQKIKFDNDDNEDNEDNDDNDDKNKKNNSTKKSTGCLSIPYSNTYTHSPGFNEIEDRFNKEYKMEILLNRGTQKIATPEILFFKDLDATLLKIGCRKRDINTFMIRVRNHILNRMIFLINSASKKTKLYKLLPLIEEISVNEEMDEKAQPQELDDNFVNHSRTGKFRCKLKFDFDEWTKSTKGERTFMTEISDALQINSSLLSIKDTKRGCVIIDFLILNIWIPFHVRKFSYNPIPRNYNMRPNDQIQVKKKETWLESTIVDIKMNSNSNGKRFKARYNAFNGKDVYKTKNTEWFDSLREGWRLNLPNQLYVAVDARGVKIHTTFIPKPLSSASTVYNVRVGHHVYVKYKNVWYRCEIIEVRNTYDGRKIQVMYLVRNFTFTDLEWLELWRPQQVSRISLNDERPDN